MAWEFYGDHPSCAGVKFWLRNKEAAVRYVVAIVAGLMLAAAFPKAGVAGFAWVAPGVLLMAAVGKRGWKAFRIGYIGGLAHFLASLYWLLLIPVSFAPIVGWIALSAYLGLYPALWVTLCWSVFPSRSDDTSNLRDVISAFIAVPWLRRLAWCLGCAASLITWEMLQARVISGFPWNLLGASQYKMLPLIQIASVTGVYGVSFGVAWVSIALISAAAAMLPRQPEKGWLWRREFFVVLLVTAIWAAWGFQRLRGGPHGERTIKIALIQPSIPQTVIWEQDDKADAERFRLLIALSERALEEKPDLVVWPEAAVPTLLRWSTNLLYGRQTVLQAVTNLAVRHNVWLIMGADDAELNARNQIDFFNSSFLISPQGQVIASYRKQRLVMFGEYVPFSRVFPFLKSFTKVYGEFKPGRKPVSFGLSTLRAKTSVLICFEDVFPHLARHHVEADTDFLLNLTNNGWFGESAAQWQHAASAVFRAVENGLPLVRAANNGLSCWVDAQGGMHEIYFSDSTDIYKAGYKIATVPLRGSEPLPSTFYNRHGDWFGWSCVALTALLALHSLRKHWTARRTGQPTVSTPQLSPA